MIRRFSLSLVLIGLVAACNAATSQPSAAPSSVSNPPVDTVASQELADGDEVVKDWLDISNVGVSPKWIVWSGIQTGAISGQSANIVLLDRATRTTRVIATAREPGGLVAWLRMNDTWAVWAEYTDRLQISDWKLRAARLPDGAPAVLLTAPQDARLDDRPEFDLSGDRLLVAARREGVSRMQVLRISLSSNAVDVLATADSGERFGWPALDGDLGVVETHTATSDGLLLFRSVGIPSAVGIGGSSRTEPTIVGQSLAFKAGRRSEDGPLVLRDIQKQTERVVADSVEAPVGRGSRLAWSAGIDRAIHVLDIQTGRTFVVRPKGLSRSFFAHDSSTLVYVGVAFEGINRYAIREVQLPR